MEVKELLERSLHEITALRHANEILQAKVEVFEACAAMVQAEPSRRGYGAMHPDIAFELRQKLDADASQPDDKKVTTTKRTR
jgi:hypothetical protein